MGSPILYAFLSSIAPRSIRRLWNEAFLRIALRNETQVQVFSRLSIRLANVYASVAAKQPDVEGLIAPFWKARYPEMEADLLPVPPFDFLGLPSVGAMSVVHYWRLVWYYTRFLETRYESRRLRDLLREDYAGHPVIQSAKYVTSSMSAQHLYHFAYHGSRTGAALDDVECVVEFGGGYGNMAKILHRLSGRPRTHVIVDLPLVTALQWLYLSTVLGPDAVNVVCDERMAIVPGKINVMPRHLLPKVRIEPDLFIATWSLSETPPGLQDVVRQLGWLEAEHLLLAWHRNSPGFPDAERIRGLLPSDALVEEMVGYYPGNFYGLR